MEIDDKGPARAAWKRKAEYEHLECSRCGNTPEYEEREEFFDTKLCGWCLHQVQKDND